MTFQIGFCYDVLLCIIIMYYYVLLCIPYLLTSIALKKYYTPCLFILFSMVLTCNSHSSKFQALRAKAFLVIRKVLAKLAKHYSTFYRNAMYRF